MPVHTFKWYGLLGWKGISFLPDLQYYSRRYITTDNLSYLPGYALLNAQVGYKHAIKGRHALEAFLSVSNLLNKQYEEIAYRPMPGTQVNGTVVYHFKQTN
jgi:vitamin B12 transporter